MTDVWAQPNCVISLDYRSYGEYI